MSEHKEWCIGGAKGPCNCTTPKDTTRATYVMREDGQFYRDVGEKIRELEAQLAAEREKVKTLVEWIEEATDQLCGDKPLDRLGLLNSYEKLAEVKEAKFEANSLVNAHNAALATKDEAFRATRLNYDATINDLQQQLTAERKRAERSADAAVTLAQENEQLRRELSLQTDYSRRLKDALEPEKFQEVCRKLNSDLAKVKEVK